MGTGTDIAIEAGNIVLVKGSPLKVVEALALSRLTFRTIRQNLFWAFFYNVAAIPLAAHRLAQSDDRRRRHGDFQRQRRRQQPADPATPSRVDALDRWPRRRDQPRVGTVWNGGGRISSAASAPITDSTAKVTSDAV